MTSEVPVPSSDNVDVVMEKPVPSSSRSKNKPGKVPRKIHKAEREKLKRDSLNGLFLKLTDTLEPAHQSNGKASVLSNATRILRDLLAQVDCLKKENTSLLSESDYVDAERQELKDENSALQVQIEVLKSEVQERIHSQYAWKLDHSQPQLETVPHLQEDYQLGIPVIEQSLQPAPVLGSVLVVPLNHHDLTVHHEPDTSDSVSTLPTSVSKPHARYPSSSDSWPSQILAIQSDTAQTVQHTSSSRED